MCADPYRNVVCPWQTPREINNARKTIDKMLLGVPEDQHTSLLRLDVPDRVWVPKADWIWNPSTGTCEVQP